MKTYDLLTLAEYAKTKSEGLYCYILSSQSQHLYYIGFNHSNDPTNPDFNTLDEYWSDFLFKTDGRERIVLVEGNIRRYFEDRDKSIIQAGGEGGYLTHLAVKNNIQVLCPELPKDSEINILLLDFTMEQIAYFFFARYMSFHPKFSDTLGFDNKSLLSLLQRMVKGSSGLDFDFSLDNMAKTHEKLFGTKFDIRDKDFFGQLVTPYENRTIINKVANKVGSIRDNWIVGEIERLWKEGKSIFIVYGSAHAVIQERAIRKIVEEN